MATDLTQNPFDPEEALLDECLGEMRRSRSNLRDASQLAGRRERSLPGIEAALIARARFRRRAVIATGVLSVAAAAALSWWVTDGMSVPTEGIRLQAVGPGVEVRDDQSEAWRSSTGVKTVAETGAVRTGAGSRVELDTPKGIHLALASSGELRLRHGLESIHLPAGQIFVDVPRLGSGEKFTVVTDHARVVVHGTRFSVAVREEAALPCVVVEEGVVEVVSRGRSGAVDESDWVRAGESLGCALPGATDVADEKESLLDGARTDVPDRARDPSAARKASANRPRARRNPVADVSTGSSDSVDSSGLAEQNRIFQRALAAERAGRLNEAKQALGQLLAKYPESPLAEQVRAQRRALEVRLQKEAASSRPLPH